MFSKHKNIPILFIGSGFSKRYLKNFPDWDSLLDELLSKISNNKYERELIEQDLEFNDDFERKVRFASVLEKKFNDTFFKRQLLNMSEKEVVQLERIYDETKISPFKVYISEKFKKMEFIDDSQLKIEIEEFEKLSESNILSVITTNYDSLVSRLLVGYEELSGKRLLLGEPEQSILKIHGCVNDISNIMITEEDYERFHDENKVIQAKLLTYFIQRPIIFIGYSLTDRNIQNIIKDIFKSLTYNDLEYKQIEKNFIFIEWKKNEEKLNYTENFPMKIDDLSLNISKIETDNYLELFKQLQKIEMKSDIKEIKKFKKLIKSLVSTNSGLEAKTLIKEEELGKISDEQVVVGFGYINEKEKVVGFDFNLSIMLDYVFIDEKQQLLKSKYIFESYYTKKKNHSSNTRYPIYKLLADIKSNNEDDFVTISQKYSTIIAKYKNKYSSLKKKIERYSDSTEINKNLSEEKKKIIWAKEFMSDNCTESEFLQKIEEYRINDSMTSQANMKDLILIYDYKKYSNML